jgi:hypothetical protein
MMVANPTARMGNLSGIAGCCVVFVIFTFAFAGHMLVNSSSDHHSHIRYALEIMETETITSPHFLFQLIFIGVYGVVPWEIASAALILGGCYAGMFVIIWRHVMREQPDFDPAIAAVLCGGILLASHIFAPTLFTPNFYYNYLVPISYHNPTQQLNKFFAIWVWVLYINNFVNVEDEHPTSYTVALLAVLLALSAMAKPSFAIAFLPISGLVALWRLAAGNITYCLRYALSVAPVAIVLVSQFLFAYMGDESRGLVFAPLAIFDEPTQYIALLPLSLALPLSCLIFLWQEARQDRAFLLAWGFMGLALAYTLLLAEATALRAGNFAWTAQTGAFILYIQSLFIILRRVRTHGRFPMVPSCILGLHVVFGGIFIIANSMVPATFFL